MSETTNKKKSGKKIAYIVLAVLILLIVAAIILVPRYQKHLRLRRAAEVRTALEAVRGSIDQMWKSTGTISGIKMAAVIKKTGIEDKITDKWQFVTAWKGTELYTTQMVEKLKDVNPNETVYVAPYKMIMAVATADNPVGEGTKLWFIGDTNSYHGFGADDKVEPDWATILPEP